MNKLEIAFYLTAFAIVSGSIGLAGLLLVIVSSSYMRNLGI
jgi:hypothetical protein